MTVAVVTKGGGKSGGDVVVEAYSVRDQGHEDFEVDEKGGDEAAVAAEG